MLKILVIQGANLVHLGKREPRFYGTTPRAEYDATIEAHAQECVEFARAIVNGEPSPVPPEESLQVMQILDGIYQSQESGREFVIE